MQSQVLMLLALAGTTLATPAQPAERQADSPEGFSTAASALISSYIPPSAFSVISASAASAASAAGITGDVNSLIYSALEASSLPGWFASAIPAAYIAPISSLTAAIASLAPTPTATLTQPSTTLGGIGSVSVDTSFSPPTVSQTVVVTTSTDSAGSVVTSSFTSAVIVTSTTSTSTASTTDSGSGSISGTSRESNSVSKIAASTSTSSTATNAAPVAGPTGVLAGVVGLVGLLAAL